MFLCRHKIAYSIVLRRHANQRINEGVKVDPLEQFNNFAKLPTKSNVFTSYFNNILTTRAGEVSSGV